MHAKTHPQTVELDDHVIAYHDLGEGDPILLIHGFASSAWVNWIATGWVAALNDAGFRCIAIDNRGHGESTKYYEAENYGPDIFARDATALLDHLGIQNCHVMGYSMGARITAWICAHEPKRVKRAIFGGMGDAMIKSGRNYDAVIAALEADDISEGHEPGALVFRKFADRAGSDRMALAACIRPSRMKITSDMIKSIHVPVLVAVGGDDEVAGSAQQLADLLPEGEAFMFDGYDHMKGTAAPPFVERAIEYLQDGQVKSIS